MQVKHGDLCLYAVNPNDHSEKYSLHNLHSIPKWTGLYGYKVNDDVKWERWSRSCFVEGLMLPPTYPGGEIRTPDYVEMKS